MQEHPHVTDCRCNAERIYGHRPGSVDEIGHRPQFAFGSGVVGLGHVTLPTRAEVLAQANQVCGSELGCEVGRRDLERDGQLHPVPLLDVEDGLARRHLGSD